MTEKKYDEEQVVDIEGDMSISHHYEVSDTGITIALARYGVDGQLVDCSESPTFLKWLKANKPAIFVKKCEGVPLTSLHSNEIWMPIVFLANDIALPVYLNLVSSYVYERCRGGLKSDVNRVHITAEYENSETGVKKRFTFSGDLNALQKAIKKVDVNEILRE